MGIDVYRQLGGEVRPSLKEVLLRGIGIAGDLDLQASVPRRGRWRARPPATFE
jgi:hypothetical protein